MGMSILVLAQLTIKHTKRFVTKLDVIPCVIYNAMQP